MIFKFLASVVILLIGMVLVWAYAIRPAPGTSANVFGDRPWRRLGAAICLMISIMFVLGIYIVDIPERPVPYALYWIIMLGLIVWLCVLAVRDFRYTRTVIKRRRAELRQAASLGPDSSAVEKGRG